MAGQNMKRSASPEEVAYRKVFIDAAQLTSLTKPLLKSGYGKYLASLLKDTVQ